MPRQSPPTLAQSQSPTPGTAVPVHCVRRWLMQTPHSSLSTAPSAATQRFWAAVSSTRRHAGVIIDLPCGNIDPMDITGTPTPTPSATPRHRPLHGHAQRRLRDRLRQDPEFRSRSGEFVFVIRDSYFGRPGRERRRSALAVAALAKAIVRDLSVTDSRVKGYQLRFSEANS